jgi:serine/threonine protein kinase
LATAATRENSLLVYDYMPNGSLDYHLHTTTPGHKNNRIDLQWAQRRCTSSEASRPAFYFYLHEDWEQVVIHRDIKTSNVLLDSEMNARIGDFGLALRGHMIMELPRRPHHTCGGDMGLHCSRDSKRLGKATKATDVFAFGVLMMEAVCGRRPIWVDKASREPHALADWVLAAWRDGSIADAAVDPRLDGYMEEEVDLVLKLGLLCSPHPSPHVRPRMRLVMQYLHGHAPLPAAHLRDADTFHTIGVSVMTMMSCPCLVHSLL